MNHALRQLWLAAIVGLALLAIWAPCPAGLVFGLRVACGVAAYAVLVWHLWRDALASFNPEDPWDAPRLPAWLRQRERSAPPSASRREHTSRRHASAPAGRAR